MAELLMWVLAAVVLGLVVGLPIATVVFVGSLCCGRTTQESWLSAAELAAHIVGDVLGGGLS
jgi:hypothetical protein